MRLDRNINPDGHGKYALLKLRSVNVSSDGDVQNAVQLLTQRGMLHFGNEGPGEQFFVMKCKDKFTALALRAYSDAVRTAAVELAKGSPEADRSDAVKSLHEYADDVIHEAHEAERFGCRIPD